jgi:hypothetical protein
MLFLSPLRCNRGIGLFLGLFGFFGLVWAVFLVDFVSWVCFQGLSLGATYKLGALYSFVFVAALWVF